jgi:UDP-GlcNAc:undecaprenyl-phosphate GlcNAc-1-phosphate transferase
MLVTLLSVLAALVISLLCTPVVRRLAIRFKIFATPNHRTIHKELIPKLGGLSIFVAFSVGLTIFALLTKSLLMLWGLLLGGGVVMLVGLFDDIYNLGCYRKLLGQILGALIAVYFGFKIQTIDLPFGNSLALGYFGTFLSVMWIITITNAVNLLDGVDGLASGITLLIALFISFGAAFFQNMEVAILAIVLIAAILGFLKYNKPPAKIFMGDSGSLFLGFSLAYLSLQAFTMPGSGTKIQILLVLFAIPLLDTSLAVVRRLRNGKHPFSPDRKHIHHRLLEMGFDQKMAVLIITTATAICGLVGLVLIGTSFQYSLILLSGVGIFFVFFLRKIGCFDFLRSVSRSSKNVNEVSFAQESTDTKYDFESLCLSKRLTQNNLNCSVEHPGLKTKSPNKRRVSTAA